MQYANRRNWKCVDYCVFFLPVNLFVVFSPLVRRVFTGNYPYPGLLWVLYNPTRTRNVCELCTTFIPVPELSIFVISVGYTQNHTRGIYPGYYPTKNICNFCKTLIPVSGTSGSSVRPCHNSRNFWKFCKTIIPVPGTSVSSVRPVPQYPGYGYSMSCTRPELV